MTVGNTRSGDRVVHPPDMHFAATLRKSFLSSDSHMWVTSSELASTGEKFSLEAFLGVTTHLLANPNLNSSHVFRADILYDSAGVMKIPGDEETDYCGAVEKTNEDQPNTTRPAPMPAESFPNLHLKRTIIRRFIPRKHIDHPINQTCHMYEEDVNHADVSDGSREDQQRCLFIFTPHVRSEDEIPYYHPSVRALALSYDLNDPLKDGKNCTGTLSIHFSPFSAEFTQFIPYRLQRTLLALLSTQLRLARKPLDASAAITRSGSMTPKDNIIRQHVFQNTYSRLKKTYAAFLVNNWVETTEPSKHVFEDIAIAAFLIELWKKMYRLPISTTISTAAATAKFNLNGVKDDLPPFPGFVDMACGNGVLTYILLSERYDGWGFDARRRKSWSIFPPSIQERLKQMICIPKPFMEVLERSKDSSNIPFLETAYLVLHSGIFNKDTFIISNHADELTLWTPLLGALPDSTSPLPFLVIPCCSHAISGVRCRHPPQKSASKRAQAKSITTAESTLSDINNINNTNANANANTKLNQLQRKSSTQEKEETPAAAAAAASASTAVEQNLQPSSGDLKALRALKLEEHTNLACQNSAYASLTAKVIQVAAEVGYGSDIDKTLLRIPSTRNIGIVGGVKRVMLRKGREGADMKTAADLVADVVERECRRDGGVKAAAKLWVERALDLQEKHGRGKWKGGDEHRH
ncbi:hypothetical protein GX48_01203 [Paracoccidioides brasiliensis]|nr:hypothetical protein GX48_01203 [Paracoccidioides brasiliensis]